MSGTTSDARVARAEALLAATAHYEELGHGQLAAEARMVARDAIELSWKLAAERSLREAIQKRCEGLQVILGKAAYEACVAAAQ